MKKLQTIEQEYGDTFENLIQEFCLTPNYMGYTFTVRGLAGILNTEPHNIWNWGRKHHIYLPRKRQKPDDHINDICWVKYGFTIEAYLKSRVRWMRADEMAIELGCSTITIRRILQRYNLNYKQLFTRYGW